MPAFADHPNLVTPAGARENCEHSDGLWSHGIVAGETLDFCIHNAEMLRNQHLFEKGKGMKLEKDLKVARHYTMLDWPDMDLVWDTYDCTLEGLYAGAGEPYYKLNGECVSYDELVKYWDE